MLLTLDEFEVVRLCDLQKLEQAAVAKKMRVHRSTISRILTSARTKIADALVHVKTIKVAGGCCKFVGD